MNKNLDHLFEQARKSMQSEMPLEAVQKLIHGQASPSLWTNQKIWIMSTSIIGILSIGILCWFNSYNHPKPITEISKEQPYTAQQTQEPDHQAILLKDLAPDNIPLPTLNKGNIDSKPATLATFEKEDFISKKANKLDSLGPKKTFTEYKLEIKKENSEQEIQKLKAELSNYGIHMEVKILDYDSDNKIKRFKGQFKTDSLFCGSTINDYEFDISGAFKSMEFIFRVADNKNLRYLKIQSENFEETIECYDDEVLSNTQEARKLSLQMHKEMARVQEEMVNAQQEMAKAQQEMARAKEEIARLKKEDPTKIDINRLEQLGLLNWDKIEADIERALENVELELEGVDEDLRKAFKNKEVIILDKNFKKDMKVLQKDLNKMRFEIEREINQNLEEHQLEHNEKTRLDFPEKGIKAIVVETSATRLPAKKQTVKELKDEAKAMEEAAKKLQKEAKEKRKMAKKMTKSK